MLKGMSFGHDAAFIAHLTGRCTSGTRFADGLPFTTVNEDPMTLNNPCWGKIQAPWLKSEEAPELAAAGA